MARDLINGEIPNHWEFTTLGEICQRGGGYIQTGPFGSQLHASDYVPVGIPSIMPTNIGDNRIIEDGIVRISEDDANRLGQHRLRVGDIVYSRRGDVEKRALIREHEEGWLCGTGCLKVRLGSGIVDPLYASLFLGHPAIPEWIVRHAVGATMPNLNTAIMSAVPFALPPLAEQKAIAAVLGALDDKIELNRRLNATLEVMARALFQSWFMDFDPVRAKLDGRHPAGLDPATAAGLPRPDIGILSDAFLAEVRGLQHKHVAAELLEKLLKDELKVRARRNLVQSQLFSEKLKKTLNAYHNRAISSVHVIEELIQLARELDAATKRGEALGLTEDEIAFYDALAANESAVLAMGDDKLKVIATELITQVRKSVTIDWTLRESARARIRVMVKRILNKYGYPPDLQEDAVKTVLAQAELLSAAWAEETATA